MGFWFLTASHCIGKTLLFLALDLVNFCEPGVLLGNALLVVLLDVVDHLLEDGLRVADDDIATLVVVSISDFDLGDLDELGFRRPGAIALEEAQVETDGHGDISSS